MDFDYFYNGEAERFNFLKVPEILVDGEEFKGLSAELNKALNSLAEEERDIITAIFFRE